MSIVSTGDQMGGKLVDEVLIDVRDLDYTWFERVKAYLDRRAGRFYLPQESADRLGEPDEDSDDYLLISGFVRAEATSIEVGGCPQAVWAIGVDDVPNRPALLSA